MKKIIFIILLLTVFSELYSQGGSNYSNYGLGDIHYNLGARYEAMGGVSTAIPSVYAINLKNPALWSEVLSTRLQAGYTFNQRMIENSNNDKLYQNNATINQILAIFSIDTAKGISASFGLLPFSSVNYMVNTKAEYNENGYEVNIINEHQGSGGVSTAYLGAAWRVLPNLSIGLSGNVYFGNIEKKVNSYIEGTYSYEPIFVKRDNAKGSGLKYGIFYQPIENLYLGFSFEQILNFDFERSIDYVNSYYGSIDSTDTYTIEAKMPNTFNVGIGYRTGMFLFGAEYSNSDFSNFNFEGAGNVKFKNSSTLALGMSRFGNSSYRATFFDRLTYNFGFGYKQLYYQVNGQDINEIYGSFGFDIPVSGLAMINSAFTIGVRGTTDNSLLKETFGRMNINISLGEIWFKPFKIDY